MVSGGLHQRRLAIHDAIVVQTKQRQGVVTSLVSCTQNIQHLWNTFVVR